MLWRFPAVTLDATISGSDVLEKNMTEDHADHAEDAASDPGKPSFKAPHPGSPQMPQWETGELIDAPKFTWRNWFAMLGPGLVLGGAAIGGGEGAAGRTDERGATSWQGRATRRIIVRLTTSIRVFGFRNKG